MVTHTPCERKFSQCRPGPAMDTRSAIYIGVLIWALHAVLVSIADRGRPLEIVRVHSKLSAFPDTNNSKCHPIHVAHGHNQNVCLMCFFLRNAQWIFRINTTFSAARGGMPNALFLKCCDQCMVVCLQNTSCQMDVQNEPLTLNVKQFIQFK